MRFLQNKTIKFIIATILYNLIIIFDIVSLNMILKYMEMSKFITRLIYVYYASNKIMLIKAGTEIYKNIFDQESKKK